MARKVYITSEMSIDERLLNVAEEDQLAALIWPWILTTFDDWGRSEAKPKKLKAKIFPGNEMVTATAIESALHLFNEHGLIELYEEDGRPYMAISADKWFKYQTQIRKVKREVDESKYPSPPSARECAQTRGDSSKNIPSPSPSTLHLPPFHPSPSIDINNDDVDSEISIGIQAIRFAEESFVARNLSQYETDSIIKWCDDFATNGSTEPDLIVIEAIKRAIEQDKRKLAYVNGILKDWYDKGITSLAHIAGLDSDWKAKKEKGKGPGPGDKPTKPPTPDKYKDFYL